MYSKLSRMTDPDCEECGGDGSIIYGGIRHSYFGDTNDDGTEELPCPKCNGGEEE
jgi:hypothetical protein